ncbi:NfeD family protein [Haloimpatiens sp. FM7330]|uniref:NfeD family protein n=1 Tax=Haloimpatiens sp. FM7330 TaxID=3298610 RepID=UPI00363FEA14
MVPFDISMLSIICFIVGFALMVVEMFHPGFGVPGITGGILLIIGIVFSAKTVVQAMLMFIIILTVLGVLLTIVLKSVSKGKLSKSLVLDQTQKKENGYICSEDLEFFLNKEGITKTVLRPSGTADFDGIKLDVVSEGDYIQRQKKVKIIKVEGRRIVVKEID